MVKRKKPVKEKVISKSEDKVWHEWYDKLTPEDHDKMLAKLGLNKDDRDEFRQELKGQAPKPTKK